MEPNGNYFLFLAQELVRLSSIAERYSQRKPRLLERGALRTVVNMLRRFSLADAGSWELLVFGFHILAVKK